jgi:hypothetical protein
MAASLYGHHSVGVSQISIMKFIHSRESCHPDADRKGHGRDQWRMAGN